MKKRFLYYFVFIILLSGCNYIGCGRMQRMRDKAKYRTLTGKKGRLILLYEGNNGIYRQYDEALITYSSADTTGIWYKPKGEEEQYFQGDAHFEPK